MSFDRLTDVETGIKELYEQLAGEEKAFRRAEEADKTRIRQRIRDTQQRIQEYENEYVTLVSQQAKRQELPETTAEVIVAELVDEIQILESTEQYDSLHSMLQEILEELKKPGTPAAAKLKVAIPIIPTLVTYEVEGDTENIMRRLFPTFKKIYEELRLLTSFESKPKK